MEKGMRRAIILAAAAIALLAVALVLLAQSREEPQITGAAITELGLDYRLLFCSETDCREEMRKLINSSGTADCAMYNFHESLASGNLRVVADAHYKGNFSFIRKRNSSGLMHNKFCILDNITVITGSFNPSSSMKDRNNMLVISSPWLARGYSQEFEELWNNLPDKKSVGNKGFLGGAEVGYYFCPEDGCAARVEQAIANASRSVLFMAYSFTHRGIANELIIASMRGVYVRGNIDSSSDKDAYYLLRNQSIDIRIDAAKGIMHHKVFIIDNETVITGSFNPTKSADVRNDENMLVIRSGGIAEEYLKEFDEVSMVSR
ncbi:DUF1669 domain-containing protein [Candidatus Woesearchaeota archaeon]|nr:DUF1669 domain-containing protein [Candidatus Woesearchaeota archaeon]